MIETCVHGTWDNVTTECICTEGWFTSDDQNIFSNTYVWCNVTARTIFSNNTNNGSFFSKVIEGDNTPLTLGVIILSILGIIGLLCLCRCCCGYKKKDRHTAPESRVPDWGIQRSQLPVPTATHVPICFVPNVQEELLFPGRTYAGLHENAMMHSTGPSYFPMPPYENCGAPTEFVSGHTVHTADGYNTTGYVMSTDPVYGYNVMSTEPVYEVLETAEDRR